MAGTEFKLKAVLGCVDKISPALKGIRLKIAGMNAAFSRVSGAAASLASSLAMPLAIIGGSGLFSIKKAIDNFTELGDSLDKASIRVGVSVKSLQVLRTAAAYGGMETGQMDKALEKLNVTMATAATGKNKAAAHMFSHLGISLKDSSGNARSAADVMRDLAEAVKNNGDQLARTQMLTALFGNKMAASLIPTLEGGAESFDKIAKSAEEAGLLMSEADVKAAAHLTDTLTRMRGTMTKVSALIGARLAPTVEKLADKFTNLLIKNKELIASKLEVVFNKLAEIIESIDVEAVIQGIDTLISVLMTLFEAIGGFNGIAVAFGLIMGGKVVLAVMNLCTAMKTLFGLMKGNVFVTVALLAVYAAVMIYRNWDRIVQWFKDAFPTLTAVIMALPEAISGAFNAARQIVQGFFNFLRSAIPDWLVNLLSGKTVMPNLQGFSAASAAPVNGRGGKGELTVRVVGDKNVRTETAYRGGLENHAYGDGYSFSAG